MDRFQLFKELLKSVSSFSFFFNKNAKQKQEIKNFQRICFIIYSGKQDQYSGELRPLIERMSEVIKTSETQHSSMLILILFIVRVLILRLSSASLKELFRNIWPMLLTLLVQVFDKKNTKQNPNLILGALKLVEQISVCQIEEFFTHQWMFVFDCKLFASFLDFGLKVEY